MKAWIDLLQSHDEIDCTLVQAIIALSVTASYSSKTFEDVYNEMQIRGKDQMNRKRPA